MKKVVMAVLMMAAFAAQAKTLEVYDYQLRGGARDVYTDGAKIGKFDPFTDGARISNRDGYQADK